MNRLVNAYHATFIENRPLAYAFAAGCVLVALALRYGFGLVSDGIAPFVTLCPAVLIACVCGGAGPGTAALLLSIVSGTFFFLYPAYDLDIRTVEGLLNLVLFALGGVVTILVGATLRAVVQQADQASRESKESARRLHTALDAGHLGSLSYDRKQDRGNWSPAFSKMLGLPATRTGMTFTEWLMIVHPEDRPLAEASLAEALATESGMYKTSYRIVRPDGSVRWLEFSATVTRDKEGNLVGLDAVALDISEQKQENERRHEIMREMHHRGQNVLAMVQALARQTAARSKTLDDFAQSFTARLRALAATHDILVKENKCGVPLADLLRSEAAAFQGLRGTQFSLDGPDLVLPPRMVTAMGLVIHELTTNAAKYGALAHEDGRVAVKWSTAVDNAGPRLLVSWSEHGGPMVATPSEMGFGSLLITRMIESDLNGDVAFHWRADGLCCIFVVPFVN